MNKINQAIGIIRHVRQLTDEVLLFYSAGGKDSIALLDMVTPYFKRVVAVYEYLIPNLTHVQPYLNWAKRYRNVEILQLEHPVRINMKVDGAFCDPDTTRKNVKFSDVEKQAQEITGLHFAFSGMKGVDGYMKRMRLKMFAKTDYITDKGMVYPLALWTNKEVLKYISSRNLIKPFKYGSATEKQVSQGFGIDKPTLLFLSKYCPEDIPKIFAEFPYAEKLLYDFCTE